jgi:hypothetical protein
MMLEAGVVVQGLLALMALQQVLDLAVMAAQEFAQALMAQDASLLAVEEVEVVTLQAKQV